VKTIFEEGQGLALGAFVGFFLAHEDFNLLGEQAANGGLATGSILKLVSVLPFRIDFSLFAPEMSRVAPSRISA
jgi:hypothetical protein